MSAAKKILVIDDDPAIYNLIKNFVGAGYEIEHGVSVDDAIRLTKDFLPHLIYLDINLEDSLGFKYLQWKRNQASLRYIKVIMISKDAFSSNVKKAIALGADDFIAKPLINKIILRKTKKAFIDKVDHRKILISADEQKAKCFVEYRMLRKDENCSIIESAARLSDKESIDIMSQRFKRRGKVAASGSGKFRYAVCKTGDSKVVKDVYRNDSIEAIEAKFMDSNPLIYCYDEDTEHNTFIQNFFNKLETTIIAFKSQEKLKEELSYRRPSVCLLSMDSTHITDFFSLVEDIAKDYPSLPIIVVSDEDDQTTLLHTLEIGAQDFIIKPIKRNLLLQKISSLVFEHVSNFYESGSHEHVTNEMVLDIEVLSFDESGMEIKSSSYVSKGHHLTISSNYIDKLINKSSLLLSVTNIERAQDGGFILFCDYINLSDKEISHLLMQSRE